MDELTLTPLELIDPIAALVPPPRTHRHRYFGALAPNSPLRASVTAMAQAVPAQIGSVQVESATTSTGEGAQIKKILDHIGVDSQAPRTFLAPPAPPARGPPLRDECDAQMGQGVEVEPDWDLAAQPAPDYEIDQRVNG